MESSSFPMGGVGRGFPLDRIDLSKPPPRTRKSETVPLGMYGVDCDFARKQHHGNGRGVPKDDWWGGKHPTWMIRDLGDESLGYSGDEMGRHNGGERRDGRRNGGFAACGGSRGQRVRFSGNLGGNVDSDEQSADTSGDEGVPQFGSRNERRRREKENRYRDERTGRDDRHYEPRFKRDDTKDRNNDYRAKRDGGWGGRGGTRSYGFRKLESDEAHAGFRMEEEQRTCYNCGHVGHLSRDCPEPRKVVTCYSCHKEGHISRKCPEKPAAFDQESNTSYLQLLTADALSETMEAVAFTQHDDNTPPKNEQPQEVMLIEIGTEDDVSAVTIATGSVTIDIVANEVKHELVQADQLYKTIMLERLLLHSGENYKDDATCDCEKMESFAACSCKKKVVVFVNRRVTVECIRVSLAAFGVTVASIHCSMDKYTRERNLAWFKYGRCPILVMMASEASGCAEILKATDWLLNVDLPLNIGEYEARIEMIRCEEKPLLVTSFYDSLVDISVAGDLIKILNDAGESVPDWLTEEGGEVGDENRESEEADWN